MASCAFAGFIHMPVLFSQQVYLQRKLSFGIRIFVVATALFEGVFVLINLSAWKSGAFLPQMIERYLIKCVYNALFALIAFAVARKVHIKKQEVRF